MIKKSIFINYIKFYKNKYIKVIQDSNKIYFLDTSSLLITADVLKDVKFQTLMLEQPVLILDLFQLKQFF